MSADVERGQWYLEDFGFDDLEGQPQERLAFRRDGELLAWVTANDLQLTVDGDCGTAFDEMANAFPRWGRPSNKVAS